MTTATDAVYFAAGFNNAAGYAIVPLQPTTVSPMLLYAAQRTGLSRARKDDARYTKLLYPRISVTYFNTLNTFFGFASLSGTNTVDGTFHLKADTDAWYDWNGTVAYIVNGGPTQRGLNSWLNVEYVITNLVKL